MKITGICERPERQGQYRVAVDGKPIGYIGAEDLFTLGLSVNREIDASVYRSLVARVKQASFYSEALKYADRRLRSKAEMRSYLKRKGCEDDNTAKIISKLEALGVIDEQKLAEAYVHDATMLKPQSTRSLEMKLQKKRLPQAIIESVLKGEEVDDQRSLDDILKRKQSLSAYKNNQPRLFRYLLSQGFSYHDIAERIGSPERSGGYRRGGNRTTLH